LEMKVERERLSWCRETQLLKRYNWFPLFILKLWHYCKFYFKIMTQISSFLY